MKHNSIDIREIQDDKKRAHSRLIEMEKNQSVITLVGSNKSRMHQTSVNTNVMSHSRHKIIQLP